MDSIISKWGKTHPFNKKIETWSKEVGTQPTLFNMGTIPTGLPYIKNCPNGIIPISTDLETIATASLLTDNNIAGSSEAYVEYGIRRFINEYKDYEEEELILVLNGCWHNEENHDSMPCLCFENVFYVPICVPYSYTKLLVQALRRNFPQYPFVLKCPICKLDSHCFKYGSPDYNMLPNVPGRP
jgi:hypothetical protein